MKSAPICLHHMRRFLHTGLFFVLSGLHMARSQEIEWADTVLGFSSQKSEKLFAADQALGLPSKAPFFGFSPCTWSPAFDTSRSSEYLSVGFGNPLRAKQAVVIENYLPGHIQSIDCIDSAGIMHNIYTRNTEESGLPMGRIFTCPLSGTLAVYGIRITSDRASRFNTYQIDAIGISMSDAGLTIPFRVVQDTAHYVAQSLGSAVNTPYDEVYPVISPDGSMLYFDRKSAPQNEGPDRNDDIWFSRLTGSGWSPAERMGPPLNNEAPNFLCSISPDGNTALVGNVYTGNDAGAGVSIAHKTDSGWAMPQVVHVDDFQNLSKYNEFSLSAGGNILLMSIETPGSHGLRDIYVSFLSASGNFSKPLNLGAVVNTAGEEMSPFLAADDKTLYYASNGLPGYGQQDIFMTRRLDDTWQHWSIPVNLGTSINTADWEAYYTIDAKGEFAYFCSARANGSNLDIYRIRLPGEAKPDFIAMLKGKITDASDGSILPANINYTNLDDSVSGGYSLSTSEVPYSLVLPYRSKYNIHIHANGYYDADTVIDLHNLTQFAEIVKNFTLIPKRTGAIIEMRNILFKANSADLEDTSHAELYKIFLFLQNNPGVHIEIRGHTNGLCDDAYCLQLSAKRAKAVADYLVTEGIEADRITWKGYGKTQPVADNSTAEGRQKNQRVEFMITQTE